VAPHNKVRGWAFYFNGGKLSDSAKSSILLRSPTELGFACPIRLRRTRAPSPPNPSRSDWQSQILARHFIFNGGKLFDSAKSSISLRSPTELGFACPIRLWRTRAPSPQTPLARTGKARSSLAILFDWGEEIEQSE